MDGASEAGGDGGATAPDPVDGGAGGAGVGVSTDAGAECPLDDTVMLRVPSVASMCSVVPVSVTPAVYEKACRKSPTPGSGSVPMARSRSTM